MSIFIGVRAYSQNIEFGFSANTTIMQRYNYAVKTPLPLLTTLSEEDINYNEINFWATEVNQKNKLNLRLYALAGHNEVGIITGLSFDMSFSSIQFTGFTDYTNAYYEKKHGSYEDYISQNPNSSLQIYNQHINKFKTKNQEKFEINYSKFKFGMTMMFGHKFKRYKSWRPYILFIPSVFSSNEIKPINSKLNYLGFTGNPNLNFKLEKSRQLEYQIGLEWRNIKLYTSLIYLKEKIDSFDSSNNFPYKKGMFINSGLTVIPSEFPNDLK